MGETVINNPNARALVVDFVNAVKSLEWDARFKALDQFTEAMMTSAVSDFILTSRSTTTRLFDIFLGGLLDVHFRVVSAVLQYGHKLLRLVPPQKHSEPLNFASKAVLRLHVAANSVQFRAKHPLIQDALSIVDELSTWINHDWSFVEILAAAALAQDAPIYGKARHAIVERLASFVATPSRFFSDAPTQSIRPLTKL